MGRRTYLLNAEFIQEMCHGKMWEWKDLAQHAKVDAKTITNIQNGKPVSAKTARGIAEAFKLPDPRVLLDFAGRTPDVTGASIPLEWKARTPAHSEKLRLAQEILVAVAKTLGIDPVDIKFVECREGSLSISIEMLGFDLIALLFSFVAGNVHPLRLPSNESIYLDALIIPRTIRDLRVRCLTPGHTVRIWTIAQYACSSFAALRDKRHPFELTLAFSESGAIELRLLMPVPASGMDKQRLDALKDSSQGI